MGLRKTLLVLSIFIALFSCRNKSGNGVVAEKNTPQHQDSGNKYQIDSTAILTGEFKFSVTSDYIYNRNQERPIFFDQMISVTKAGTVIYSQKHGGGYDSVKTTTGYLHYLNNFITQIGVIKSDGRNYFIIDGWGGCNYCSTYSAIIDESGELQYELFRNEKQDTVYSRIGDLDKVLGNENDLKKYMKGAYDMIERPCSNCVQSENENPFQDPYN